MAGATGGFQLHLEHVPQHKKRDVSHLFWGKTSMDNSDLSRFGFFGLPDWPGLAPALAQRPVTKADVDLWGRANVLWQGGQHFGCKK